MIRNEICCDICRRVVADVRKGFLSDKIIRYIDYVELPLFLSNEKPGKIRSKKAHICYHCMDDFVCKALKEKQ